MTVGTFHAVCHRMLRPHAERVGPQPGASRSTTPSRAAACSPAALAERGRATSRRPGWWRRRSRSGQGAAARDAARLPGAARQRAHAPGARPGRATSGRSSESDALDFDDLIARAVRLLERARPARALPARARRASWSTSTRTRTRPSTRWVRLLAGEHRNLTRRRRRRPGDLRLARRRRSRNVLGFERDFPGARSRDAGSATTARAADRRGRARLIEHNRERRPKTLSAAAARARRCWSRRTPTSARRRTPPLRWCARTDRPGRAGRRDRRALPRPRARPAARGGAARRSGVPHRVLGRPGAASSAPRCATRSPTSTLVVNPRDRVALARALCTRRGIGPVAVARLAGLRHRRGNRPARGVRARAGEVAGAQGRAGARRCERFGWRALAW